MIFNGSNEVTHQDLVLTTCALPDCQILREPALHWPNSELGVSHNILQVKELEDTSRSRLAIFNFSTSCCDFSNATVFSFNLAWVSCNCFSRAAIFALAPGSVPGLGGEQDELWIWINCNYFIGQLYYWVLHLVGLLRLSFGPELCEERRITRI